MARAIAAAEARVRKVSSQMRWIRRQSSKEVSHGCLTTDCACSPASMMYMPDLRVTRGCEGVLRK